MTAERQQRRALNRLDGHRVLAGLEHPDLADDVTGTGTPDLDRAAAGQGKRRRQGPGDDEHELPSRIALLPEDVSL